MKFIILSFIFSIFSSIVEAGEAKIGVTKETIAESSSSSVASCFISDPETSKCYNATVSSTYATSTTNTKIYLDGETIKLSVGGNYKATIGSLEDVTLQPILGNGKSSSSSIVNMISFVNFNEGLLYRVSISQTVDSQLSASNNNFLFEHNRKTMEDFVSCAKDIITKVAKGSCHLNNADSIIHVKSIRTLKYKTLK